MFQPRYGEEYLWDGLLPADEYRHGNSAFRIGAAGNGGMGRQGRTEYALEGSVFIAGAAIQWLRDEMKLISDAAESEALARSVPDTHGVYLVPAFVGLGAPHWDAYARGTITGITRGANRAHLVRAALESIAYQTREVVDAMAHDSGLRPEVLRVDGGAARNDFLCQFQADILGIPWSARPQRNPRRWGPPTWQASPPDSGRMSGNSLRICNWAAASNPVWTSPAARNCLRAGNAPWSALRDGCIHRCSRLILW